MSLDLTDDKSTLVQVMAWCRQAPSHYLSQCWPRSVSPYDVTKPQWVSIWMNTYILYFHIEFNSLSLSSRNLVISFKLLPGVLLPSCPNPLGLLSLPELIQIPIWQYNWSALVLSAHSKYKSTNIIHGCFIDTEAFASQITLTLYIYIYIYIYMCVCVCVYTYTVVYDLLSTIQPSQLYVTRGYSYGSTKIWQAAVETTWPSL